jgi:ADP-ribose pyrophosphatase
MNPRDDIKVIKEGKFLRLLSRSNWEYVDRRNISGIVVIAALTDEGKLVLVEQFRIPVNAMVIELPAGLAGDRPEDRDEDFVQAARRELIEETGYDAARFELVASGPISPGMSFEEIDLFVATGLKRVSAGGGDETEDIIVHEVPIGQIGPWLRQKQADGSKVDPKVFAGVYFLEKMATDGTRG